MSPTQFASLVPFLVAAVLVPAASAQRPHMGNSRPTAITPGVTGPSPVTTAYFAATEGTSGVELWRTDGSSAGTTRIQDIEPGSAGSYPAEITWTSGGGAFFTARTKLKGRELYYTDGATAQLIEDIAMGAESSEPRELTVIGGRVYFTAYTSSSGRQVWWATSTPGSARAVSGTAGISPHGLVAVGSMVFFTGTTAAAGTELNVMAVPSGAVTLIDIRSGVTSSMPSELTAFGGYVYFAAAAAGRGRELWRSNGVTTERVTDIRAGTASSNPNQLTAGSSQLAFTALHPTLGRQLFTIGTSGTPTVRSSFTNGRTIRNLTAGGGTAFWFTADEAPYGTELYRMAGAAAPVLVDDVNPGVDGSDPSNLMPNGTGLIFCASKPGEGHELRTTTGSGSALLADLKTGAGAGGNAKSSFPGRLSPFGTGTYLCAAEGSEGIELWFTDGTAFGTRQVVSGKGLDPSVVLPEQRVSLTLTGLTVTALRIEIEDAPKSQPGWAYAGLVMLPTPVPIQGVLRGALVVDPGSALFVLPFTTDTLGNALLNIPIPSPNLGAPVPLGWQSLIATGLDAGESLVASQNYTSTAGRGQTPTGKSAAASGHADDDTGEADVTVTSGNWTTDSEAWLALAIELPNGEIVPIAGSDGDVGGYMWPIGPNETLRIRGTFDFYTPTDPADPTSGASKLILLIFDEPPAPSELKSTTTNVCWRSYC